MLYDPLAVKRRASAVCVLPPTPRSRIGTSGCQGCESASTTESARELGLDAGAPGRLYCGLSQEEEQQRPGVGHGISERKRPARRTWRRAKDEPGEPNTPAQSHSGRKTTRPTLERSDLWGVWGAVPTSSLG